MFNPDGGPPRLGLGPGILGGLKFVGGGPIFWPPILGGIPELFGGIPIGICPGLFPLGGKPPIGDEPGCDGKLVEFTFCVLYPLPGKDEAGVAFSGPVIGGAGPYEF